MIYYLTEHVDDELMAYPSRWGGAGEARMRFLPYRQLPEMRRLEPGTYLFADLESLTPANLEIARQTCALLSAAPTGFRVVNHPERVLCRLALLEKLFEAGINEFRVYPARDAGRVVRFPVFVRRGEDHGGARTPLQHDAPQLARTLRFLRLQGHRMSDLLIVEFCDTSGPDDLYRKYAAFVVGPQVLPRHVLFSRHWMQKRPDLRNPALEAEAAEYLLTNPHRESLQRIARLAGVEYGRIDYGIRRGRVQVWEINTHPTVTTTTPRLTQAFTEIEAERCDVEPLELDLAPKLVRRARWERTSRRMGDAMRRGVDGAASSPLAKPMTRALRHWMGQSDRREDGETSPGAP